MGRIGFGELLVVFFVILLLFGARKLPEIGAALGKAMRDFKRASQGHDDEDASQEQPSKKS